MLTSFGVAAFVATQLFGSIYDSRPTIGVCGNRELPSNKIRKLRNLRLECASNYFCYRLVHCVMVVPISCDGSSVSQ